MDVSEWGAGSDAGEDRPPRISFQPCSNQGALAQRSKRIALRGAGVKDRQKRNPAPRVTGTASDPGGNLGFWSPGAWGGAPPLQFLCLTTGDLSPLCLGFIVCKVGVTVVPSLGVTSVPSLGFSESVPGRGPGQCRTRGGQASSNSLFLNSVAPAWDGPFSSLSLLQNLPGILLGHIRAGMFVE